MITKNLLLLLFAPYVAIAQIGKVDSLHNSKPIISYSYIKDSIREAGGSVNEDSKENEMSFDTIEAILSLNVFSYYKLDETYNTELKKANYKDSQEYKDKLRGLKSIKSDFLKTDLFIELNRIEDFQIYDYDLNKGGFYIRLGFTETAERYFYGKYRIKSFPQSSSHFETRNGPPYGPTLYDRIFFLPMNKTIAGKLEDDRSNIKCILIFKPSELMRIKQDRVIYSYYDSYVTVNTVRLLIINAQTSAIYWDKSYNSNDTPIKK